VLTPSLRNYLLLLSALWILGCSHVGFQAKEEETYDLIPDCQRNYTKEGGLIHRPFYKTWVKYDDLDVKRGFDLAVRSLRSHGH